MMVDILAKAPSTTSDLIQRSPFADIPGAEEVFKECIWRSIEIRQGLVDGKIACVWGLIPPTVLSTTAYLWLLTTDIIAEHKFLFVRHSQRYIEEALKKYPTIIGEVIGHNPSASRWIHWLGGEFGPMIGGRTPFTIRAK
jgi:hypothetical protein